MLVVLLNCVLFFLTFFIYLFIGLVWNSEKYLGEESSDKKWKKRKFKGK